MRKKKRPFTSLPVRIPNRGLTEKQIKLLSPENLAAYIDLDEGRLYPTSDKHVHFIAVCRDNLPPITEIERTYLLWRSLILKEISYNPPVKMKSKLTRTISSTRGVATKKTGSNWPEWIKNGGRLPPSHAPIQTVAPSRNDPNQMSTASILLPAPNPTRTDTNKSGARISVNKIDRSNRRFIDEPWGTREAWKRDRGSWRR
ncbi:MAG: hypothetical protein ACK5X0_05860 [Rhodospirillales bacterium]|jgi:hypothetical protein